MKILFFIIAIFFVNTLYSAVAFSSDQIVDSLLKNANAVIRYDSISYTLINQGKAELSRYRVITILNKYGEEFAENYVLFDKNVRVNSFSGEILDASGNRIRKIKKDDITDNSLVGSYNLFQDDRYLSFTALNPIYPYTIVSEYTITINGIVSIDRWIPIPDYNVSVEKSVFEISTKNIGLKFKTLNFDNRIQSYNSESGNFYKWVLKNRTALESEPFSPSLSENLPVVWAVPEIFEYEGKKGSFESWQSFGKWEWELIEKKQDLPETTKIAIRKITENASDDKEKVKILYNFLQNKTRYVSVQLGIGGWEPFSASIVDEVGYGDCKALSNYMVALLKAVNVSSFYALIGNGDQKILYSDFPSMGQANHVVVCVPFQKDSIWLECTNQEYPFGYIGKGNNGRYALLITPEGGKLVKTSLSGKNENLQIRNATITIDDAGTGIANINTSFKGLQFSNRYFLMSESKEVQKKWYLENLTINSPVLNRFSLTKSISQPLINEELEVIIPKGAVVTGNRLFLRPNLLNAFSTTPPKTSIRNFNIRLDFEFTDIDTINYLIPAGYLPESVFNSTELNSEFGNYSVKVEIDNNKLTYIRKIQINAGTWPTSKYEEFRTFMNSVWKTDQANIVYKKN